MLKMCQLELGPKLSWERVGEYMIIDYKFRGSRKFLSAEKAYTPCPVLGRGKAQEGAITMRTLKELKGSKNKVGPHLKPLN